MLRDSWLAENASRVTRNRILTPEHHRSWPTACQQLQNDTVCGAVSGQRASRNVLSRISPPQRLPCIRQAASQSRSWNSMRCRMYFPIEYASCLFVDEQFPGMRSDLHTPFSGPEKFCTRCGGAICSELVRSGERFYSRINCK
jgi:hypothetical protein